MGRATLFPGIKHSEESLKAMRRRFAKRWNLPWLHSKAIGKFVKGSLIDAGMPDPFKSLWQGHRPVGGNMD